MEQIETFWAEQGAYEPCGMFTLQHGFLFMLSILILLLTIFLTRNLTVSQIRGLTRWNAVLFLILELIKIGYNFYYHYYWLDSWFPVAFCSIFLYALWMSGFGSGVVRKLGDAFLAGGSAIAGFAYLLFPSTSLMLYPAGHYLSLHSMFFHTMMIYLGYLYLSRLCIPFTMQYYLRFIQIFAIFAIISILLNLFCSSNLMLLREPFHIPIRWLHLLYQTAPVCYTILILLVYLFVPYGLSWILHDIFMERFTGIKHIFSRKS